MRIFLEELKPESVFNILAESVYVTQGNALQKSGIV